MTPFQVVTDRDREPAKGETVAARIARLQAEAKALARDHVKSLTAAMADLEQLAAEIAEGGEAYHVGAREAARSLAEDLQARIGTINVIAGRT